MRATRSLNTLRISAADFFSLMGPPSLPGSPLPIPTEAAAVALFECATLESSAAHRANPVDQGGNFSPGKVHRTRAAPALPDGWTEKIGGDPGADSPG